MINCKKSNQQFLVEAEIDLSTPPAIKELENTKIGTEILSPIADGIFIKTTLQKNTTAIVNVGRGITTEKTMPQVISMVESHKQNINKNIEKIESQMQLISNTLLEKITRLEMNKSNQVDHSI